MRIVNRNRLGIFFTFLFTEPMTIEEQCENGATLIPHPSECQLYYNCSLRYVHVPRYFAQHMQECPYPQLFNAATKQCDNFENVDCAKRKEIANACKYLPTFSLFYTNSTDLSMFILY